MRWCVCKQWGPPSSLSIEEGPPLPRPGAGEVAIAVAACAVNFPDLLIVQGKYQIRPKFPFAPGGEVAGVVSALGDGCTRFRLGDGVVAFVGVGGFATDIVVKESSVAPLPSGMDFITASSFLVAYGTADYALRVRANLRKGELVLILGASGGVGLAAVQLAKAAGATVIAAASTPEKLRACRDSGADLLLDYRQSDGDSDSGGGVKTEVSPSEGRRGRGQSDWRRALMQLTGGRAVDVVLDNVGGADCETAVRSLAVRGRYLVVGFASGTIPSPPLNLVLLREACVMGVFWGAWREREPDESAEQMIELVRLFRLGRLKPVVSRVYPLDQAPRALEDMGARKVVGKVVIDNHLEGRDGCGGGGGGGSKGYGNRNIGQGGRSSTISRL
ncbi:unnamed protein product [Pylaiella littoralis]